MIRAGLSVPCDVIDAAEHLATAWGITTDRLRGMSPFGGNSRDQTWGLFDPRLFLADTDRGATRMQAIFRAAFFLPDVASVVVGSDDPHHLRELVDAVDLDLAPGVVARYRELVRRRQTRANSSRIGEQTARAAS
jgi:aryl-alcohol dehydrogenase-like predicted oxidoreductase